MGGVRPSQTESEGREAQTAFPGPVWLGKTAPGTRALGGAGREITQFYSGSSSSGCLLSGGAPPLRRVTIAARKATVCRDARCSGSTAARKSGRPGRQWSIWPWSFFALAVVHTFAAVCRGPIDSHQVGSGILPHFLAETEVVFGLWAAALFLGIAPPRVPSRGRLTSRGLNYSEPVRPGDHGRGCDASGRTFSQRS